MNKMGLNVGEDVADKSRSEAEETKLDLKGCEARLDDKIFTDILVSFSPCLAQQFESSSIIFCCPFFASFFGYF